MSNDNNVQTPRLPVPAAQAPQQKANVPAVQPPAQPVKVREIAPATPMGFGSTEGFVLMQRVAKCFSQSELVPKQYQGPAGMPNCVIAINIAQRLGADPLMVMQNLYIVHGRPGWSSTFIIGAINSCGRFNPLRFDIRKAGKVRVGQQEIDNLECVAWTTEKQFGLPAAVAKIAQEKKISLLEAARELRCPILESPPSSIDMAVREGWYTKNGSKWVTMPQNMLRYRAATFFGRIYAPDILMGLRTSDEVADVFGGGAGIPADHELPTPGDDFSGEETAPATLPAGWEEVPQNGGTAVTTEPATPAGELFGEAPPPVPIAAIMDAYKTKLAAVLSREALQPIKEELVNDSRVAEEDRMYLYDLIDERGKIIDAAPKPKKK